MSIRLSHYVAWNKHSFLIMHSSVNVCSGSCLPLQSLYLKIELFVAVCFCLWYFSGEMISDYKGSGNLMLMAMREEKKPTWAELWCGQKSFTTEWDTNGILYLFVPQTDLFLRNCWVAVIYTLRVFRQGSATCASVGFCLVSWECKSRRW